MATSSKLPYNFIKEQITKFNKRVPLNDKFIPDYTTNSPTAKFYSKYETGEAINLTPEKWAHYLSLVEGHLKNKPKDKYTEPITESQEIGWTPGPMFKYEGLDIELFCHPRNKNDITIIGDQIAANKLTARDKYTGIPFQLN